jgi:hypothetical protein
MTNLISLQVPSFSDPTQSYTVYKSVQDGAWVCTCGAWKFSKGQVKSCKHLTALAVDLQLHAAFAVAAAPSN